MHIFISTRLFIYLITSLSLSIITCQPANAQQTNFNAQWRQIDKLLSKKGKLLRASKQVDSVLLLAQQQKANPHWVKALMYKIKITSAIDSAADVHNIKFIKQQLQQTQSPVIAAFLNSMLGELYVNYYKLNINKYSPYLREIPSQSDDLRQWNFIRLKNEIKQSFLRSIENPKTLQKILLKDYKMVLLGDATHRKLRSTLFEFFAQRAINTFNNDEFRVFYTTKDLAKTDQPKYYSLPKTFLEHTFQFQDSTSYSKPLLETFQLLTTFYTQTNQTEALAQVTLQRLKLIQNHNTNPKSIQQYLETLKILEKRFAQYPVSSEYSYLIAKHYYELGGRYESFNEKVHQDKLKMAYDIAKRGLQRFKKGIGHQQNQALINLILEKKLDVQMMDMQSPQTAFQVSVLYKNVQHLYWRIVTFNHKKMNKLAEIKEVKNRPIKYLLKQKVIRSWATTLPDPKDYQPHRLEEKIEGLPVGTYLLMVSARKGFPIARNRILYRYLTITPFAYFTRKTVEGKLQLYVVNRKNGQPIANAQVTPHFMNYAETRKNKQRLKITKGKTYITDKYGAVNISAAHKENKSSSYYITIQKGKNTFSSREVGYIGDYLPQNNLPLSKVQLSKQKSTLKTYFYFDRKIYRPGQQLYYKGLVIRHKIYNNQYALWPQHRAKIRLLRGGQTLTDTIVKVNEYGSFSGSFVLPKSGKLGVMNLSYELLPTSLDAQLLDSLKKTPSYKFSIIRPKTSDNFSVEAYKRPTFSMQFLKQKQQYEINQEITIKGKAQAFNGSFISGAKVVYTIEREVKYKYPPKAGKREQIHPNITIKYGKVTTSTQGVFAIKFKAVADTNADYDRIPIFIYTIKARVTDINGESHSQAYTIQVGYDQEVLSVILPEAVDPTSTTRIKLITKNLQDDNIASQGSIKIYQLQLPKGTYRDKLWAYPDQFNYSKEAWKKWFPNDLQRPTDDIARWKRVALMYEAPYRTFVNTKKNVLILNQLKKWPQGKYVLVMENQPDGKSSLNNKERNNVIRIERYFELIPAQSKQIIVPKIDYFVPTQTTVTPGDTAKIWVGSSLKVNALFTISIRGKVISQEWKKINQERTLWQIPVTNQLQGNFSVSVTFVKDNRFYENRQLFTVPYDAHKLDVRFETFRNKLRPGQKEQWRIKIRNRDKSPAMAEMVATLYDASLNAFRPNFFEFDPFSKYYGTPEWSSHQNFKGGYTYSYQTYHWTPFATYVPQKFFEELRWFGYSFAYYPDIFKKGKTLKPYKNWRKIRRQLRKNKLEYSEKREVISELRKVLVQPEVIEVPDEMVIDEEIEVNLDVELTEEIPPPPKQFGTSLSPNTPLLANIKTRKNFNETAFFYPHLRTNAKGEIVIEFTIPESLTSWQMQGFAHTKDLKFGFLSNTLVTKKELMVSPNMPRFLRQGDQLWLVSKVTNLSDSVLVGKSQLQLLDALTNTPINQAMLLSEPVVDFKAAKGQNTTVAWKLRVPKNLQAVTYRIVAAAGKFSDGEENTLPVLSDRVLVTESLPLSVNQGQTKRYSFDKLKKSNQSKTLRHHQYTLEFTPNPAWYALQSLPYLMEFPYECAEQTFSRWYANQLAAHIIKANPKTQQVFETWKKYQPEALQSNLEQNTKLKSILIQETPWVREANNDKVRQKRLALLFDFQRLSTQANQTLEKLLQKQASNGGFPWFEGMYVSLYITQHIVSGFGHLQKMGVINPTKNRKVQRMLNRAIRYMDKRTISRYEGFIKKAEELEKSALKKYLNQGFTPAQAKEKAQQTGRLFLQKSRLYSFDYQYLYARSFFITQKSRKKPEKKPSKRLQKALKFQLAQARKHWKNQPIQVKAMLALALHRWGDKATAQAILNTLKQQSQYQEDLGRYWVQKFNFQSYDAPIETQAILIEAFHEVTQDQSMVTEMKNWLLRKKRRKNWSTTKATTLACYALLTTGSKLLSQDNPIEIKIGDETISTSQLKENDQIKTEAGTGRLTKRWSASQITPNMGNIEVSNQGKSTAWGAVYWQYFEQMDKVTPATTPLKLKRQLLLQRNTSNGTQSIPINRNTKITVGDVIQVKLTLESDREMEYLHLKDLRASGLEPTQVFSRYKFANGLGYYQSTRDATTHFFIDYLPKGKFEITYLLKVTHQGQFSNGIATIENMYAPEFRSNSEGLKLKVDR